MRWKGGKRWAFWTPSLFLGACPLNNSPGLSQFSAQLLVGRNAGNSNCSSQIEPHWSSALIPLSGSPHHSLWSVSPSTIISSSAPGLQQPEAGLLRQPFKQQIYLANDSGLVNTYIFFWFAVIQLEACLGFLLSTVNTHSFTQKKMEPCLGTVYAEENRYFLQSKSNDQKLEGTVRAHQIHALLGQIERSLKYPGQQVVSYFIPWAIKFWSQTSPLFILCITESFLLQFTTFLLVLTAGEEKNRCSRCFQ